MTLGDCQLITTRSGTSTIQTQSSLPGPRVSFLTLDLGQSDTWSFWFSDPYIMVDNESKLVCPDRTSVNALPQQSYFWSPQNRTMGLTFPASGFTLTGRLTMPAQVNVPMIDPNSAIINREVTWNFNPIGTAEIEVVVDSTPLDEWRPLGALNGSLGNTLDLTARLLEKGKDTPPQNATVLRWIWEFTNVSHEPGVLMNYPRFAEADTKPDLRFEEILVLVAVPTGSGRRASRWSSATRHR